MERLVFTVATGNSRYAEMALGLGRSLSTVGDRTPRAILTDLEGEWHRYFDFVIRPSGPPTALDHLRALDLTDADHVIALDCDCLAFRPLDDIFTQLEGKPFVVQGDHHSDGIWHETSVAEVCRRFDRTSIPRFNGGFLYYERHPDTFRLIDEMRSTEAAYETTGFGKFRGKASQEVCILLAMLRCGLGEVVPDERDYMSTGVGLVGALQMDIQRSECRFLCRRGRVRYIRPYIFHASRYSNFLVYWRQIFRLRRMWQDAVLPLQPVREEPMREFIRQRVRLF
jgi:hypothetical protein